MLATCKSKVVFKEYISDCVLKVGLVKPDGFNFLPGQFISIKIANGVLRSYSISSATYSDYIELLIDLSPGGIGSKYIKSLKKDQTVDFIGPLGHMYLNSKDLSKTLGFVFVATGTGIAPFLSVLSFLNYQKYKGKVVLFYSEKFFKDFSSIDYKDLDLTLFKSTTKEKVEKHLFGRVTRYLKEYPINKDFIYYLCGKKEMVFECEDFLKKNKVSVENIKKEVYY